MNITAVGWSDFERDKFLHFPCCAALLQDPNSKYVRFTCRKNSQKRTKSLHPTVKVNTHARLWPGRADSWQPDWHQDLIGTKACLLSWETWPNLKISFRKYNGNIYDLNQNAGWNLLVYLNVKRFLMIMLAPVFTYTRRYKIKPYSRVIQMYTALLAVVQLCKLQA